LIKEKHFNPPKKGGGKSVWSAGGKDTSARKPTPHVSLEIIQRKKKEVYLLQRKAKLLRVC